MSAPVSIRLDSEVRTILEAEAKAQGVGLASYLRQLATQAAHDVRRARIRTASAAVARHAATDAAANEFAADWGSSQAEGL